MSSSPYGPGVEITGRITPEYAQILTPEAVAFVAKLQRAFGGRRNELLARRAARQKEFDAGKLPDFLPETRAIREGSWTCAPVPADMPVRAGAKTVLARSTMSGWAAAKLAQELAVPRVELRQQMLWNQNCYFNQIIQMESFQERSTAELPCSSVARASYRYLL